MPWMVPAAMVGSAAIGAMSQGAASSAANKSAMQQAQLAAMDYALKRDMALEQQRMGRATQFNARGGQTVYDEKSNTWRTITSPEEDLLMKASDREQRQSLTHDAIIKRQNLVAQDALARDERGMAGVYQDRLRRGSPDNAESGVNRVIVDAMQGLNEGSDDALNAMATQDLRSGSTGSAVRQAILAREMGKGRGEAMRGARAEGEARGNEAESNYLNRNSQIYTALTGRNPVVGAMPYSPIASESVAALDSSRKQANAGGYSGMLGMSGAMGGLNAALSPLSNADRYNSTAKLFAQLPQLLQGLKGVNWGGSDNGVDPSRHIANSNNSAEAFGSFYG